MLIQWYKLYDTKLIQTFFVSNLYQVVNSFKKLRLLQKSKRLQGKKSYWVAIVADVAIVGKVVNVLHLWIAKTFDATFIKCIYCGIICTISEYKSDAIWNAWFCYIIKINDFNAKKLPSQHRLHHHHNQAPKTNPFRKLQSL